MKNIVAPLVMLTIASRILLKYKEIPPDSFIMIKKDNKLIRE